MDKKPQRIAKENAVTELQELFRVNQAEFLADYRGLTVLEVTALRKQLRESGATYKVVKNTLLKRASNAEGITELDSLLEGPTAIAFTNDPVGAAKVFSDFAKTHKALEMKAGLLEGQFLAPGKIDALAKIPSKEVLLSQVLAGMQAPLAGFAGCCSAMLRGFAYSLDQIRAQKEA